MNLSSVSWAWWALSHSLLPMDLCLTSSFCLSWPFAWNFALTLSYIRCWFRCYFFREAFTNLPYQKYPSTNTKYLIIFQNLTILGSIHDSFQYQKLSYLICSLSLTPLSGEHKHCWGLGSHLFICHNIPKPMFCEHQLMHVKLSEWIWHIVLTHQLLLLL